VFVHRIVHKADFNRLLAAPPRSRSAHFALHHAAPLPIAATAGLENQRADGLSTDSEHEGSTSVDNCRLGYAALLPKRHARRAVTRNLLRRQIRGAFMRHAPIMPPGLWLVRLRSPWSREQFPSAASKALAQASRAELDVLLHAAAKRMSGASRAA
jgi:ribonuclease P protein component